MKQQQYTHCTHKEIAIFYIFTRNIGEAFENEKYVNHTATGSTA